MRLNSFWKRLKDKKFHYSKLRGEIPEEQIDDSVRKILKAKGLKVE